MALFGKLFPAAAGLLVAASALGAQAAKTCDIEISKGALARSTFTIEQARSAQGAAATAALSNVVKQLEGIDAPDQAAGRSLLLGESLALWLSQPGMSMTPKRSSLGFTKNPDATIDLIGAIDSLFTSVETTHPSCVEMTTPYRGGLPGYINLANGAISALNAGKLDSAEYLATQANRLYAGSPYGSMVLGNVAAKRNDNAKALRYYAQAATDAAKDSLYRDVERQMLYNSGLIELQTAQAASGAERSAAAKRAAALFQRMLALPGTKDAFLTSGRSSYQTALLLTGDTAAVTSSYAPMLASPSSYGYIDLLNAAVSAARANHGADAAKLFEASLAANPYNRDALYNLGLTYLSLEQNDKVAPIATRLVAIDPANPENYNLSARAYLALAKAAKTAKKQPLVVAYNDSTMKWYVRGNTLPVEVTFSALNSTDKAFDVSGTVLDRRDKIEASAEEPATPAKGKKPAAAKAKPALAPTAVTLKFDALDAKGNVLGTQSVTTKALMPGDKDGFKVSIPSANAVAFRYSLGS